MNRPAQAGFTLAEILVVLVILGLLAGLVFTRLAGQTERARIQTARMQVAALEEAIRRFESDNGFYPETEQGLEALVQKPTTGREPRNWAEGGYLDRGVPLDPWGNQFKYLAPGVRSRDFDVWSAGPDGVDGTDDDVGNW